MLTGPIPVWIRRSGWQPLRTTSVRMRSKQFRGFSLNGLGDEFPGAGADQFDQFVMGLVRLSNSYTADIMVVYSSVAVLTFNQTDMPPAFKPRKHHSCQSLIRQLEQSQVST